MRFYWVRDRIQQNHFHVLWEEGKKNLAYYATKHHPIWHHRKMRPRYVKETKKYIEKSKDRKMGLGEGVLEPPIPGKPGNRITPLKESGIQFLETRIILLRESKI